MTRTPAVWFGSVILCAVLVGGLLCGCRSPQATPAPSPSEAPPTTEPSASPDTGVGPPDRVDVIYFHRPQRCVTCLCFEERIRSVMGTHFREELESGTLTLQVLDLGDRKNEALAEKYVVVGSQLFIVAVRDGAESVRDVQEIWSWDCLGDREGFDEAIRSCVARTLKGLE